MRGTKRGGRHPHPQPNSEEQRQPVGQGDSLRIPQGEPLPDEVAGGRDRPEVRSEVIQQLRAVLGHDLVDR